MKSREVMCTSSSRQDKVGQTPHCLRLPNGISQIHSSDDGSCEEMHQRQRSACKEALGVAFIRLSIENGIGISTEDLRACKGISAFLTKLEPELPT